MTNRITDLRPAFLSVVPVSETPKRLVIFGSDSVISHQHIKDILPTLARMNIRPLVFITPDTSSPRGRIPELLDYTFYEDGILDEIYPALDRLSGKARMLSASFAKAARAFKFDVIRVGSLKDPAIEAAYRSGTDIIGSVSIYQDQIFKTPLIETIKSRGFFWNLHPGLLPENRGLFLAFWQLKAGLTSHGYTLHEIDAGIDTGRILGRYQGALDPSKSVIENYFDFIPSGSKLLETTLIRQLNDGHVRALDVGPRQPGYFTFPTRDDIKAAADAGIRMVGTPDSMTLTYARIFGSHPELARITHDAVCRQQGIEASAGSATHKANRALRPN